MALPAKLPLAATLALAPSRESVSEALGVGARDADKVLEVNSVGLALGEGAGDAVKELEVQAVGLDGVPVGVGRALADRESVVLAVVLIAPNTVASVADAAVAKTSSPSCDTVTLHAPPAAVELRYSVLREP